MKINNTFIDENLLKLLVSENYSTSQISLKLGIAENKVRYFCKRLGIKPIKLKSIDNNIKVITICLTNEQWSLLKSFQGQKYNDKVSWLINHSKAFKYLSLDNYKREYLKQFPNLKLIKRRQLFLSLHNYNVLKSCIFKKDVSLNFSIWFLLSTYYQK